MSSVGRVFMSGKPRIRFRLIMMVLVFTGPAYCITINIFCTKGSEINIDGAAFYSLPEALIISALLSKYSYHESIQISLTIFQLISLSILGFPFLAGTYSSIPKNSGGQKNVRLFLALEAACGCCFREPSAGRYY